MARTAVSVEVSDRADHEAVGEHTRLQDDHAVDKSHLWRHFVEMSIAMAAGMAALGVPFQAILTSLGYTWEEAVAGFPEIVCLVMTFNMVVGMIAWMRFRGHGWRASAEMAFAMYTATAVTLGMSWLHIISEDALLGLTHVLMLPAMLFTMLYRRDEYANAHHRSGA